jgi:hypothetical protein
VLPLYARIQNGYVDALPFVALAEIIEGSQLLMLAVDCRRVYVLDAVVQVDA